MIHGGETGFTHIDLPVLADRRPIAFCHARARGQPECQIPSGAISAPPALLTRLASTLPEISSRCFEASCIVAHPANAVAEQSACCAGEEFRHDWLANSTSTGAGQCHYLACHSCAQAQAHRSQIWTISGNFQETAMKLPKSPIIMFRHS